MRIIDLFSGAGGLTFGFYYRLDKISELSSKVEELEDELIETRREYEDLEEDLEENYRPIPLAELYGVSARDFY